MTKLTNVSCEYTGGGVYVYSALLNDEVWFVTDFQTYDSYGCYDAPIDVVERDLTADGYINYDKHWKDPSCPLPTWLDILCSLRDAEMDFTADEVYKRLPRNAYMTVGDDTPPDCEPLDPHTERMCIIEDFIEVFEDFLDEKGIVIPNDEKDQSPDSASNIYGTDYGDLSHKIESLLIRLGYMKKEV